MARGFLGGLISGGIVVLGLGGVVSLLAPMPQPPQIGATPGAAETPEADIEVSQARQSIADTPTAPASQTATPSDTPAPDDLASLDETTTASAGQPETGEVGDIAAPSVVATARNDVPRAEAPVQANPRISTPATPEAVEELSISTEPAQPMAPPLEAVEGAFDLPVQPEVGMIDAPVLTAPAAEAEEEPLFARTPIETQAEPGAPQPRRSSPANRVDEPDAANHAVPESLHQTAQATAGESGPENASVATGPRVGKPARDPGAQKSGVIVNRLPNIAEDVATEDQVKPDTAAEQAEPDAAPVAEPDPRAIIRNAMPFTSSEDKPLMAIVLIDNGKSLTGGEAGLAALRSFPYPVSFAVDATLPDAAERMQAFREEGFEVLAMVDLPEGATPGDAETNFAVALGNLPQAVAVLEGTKGGLQVSRDVSDHVAAMLAESGHGLVTQDRGLNTVPKLARKNGVPAAPVFRDFDSKDQTPTVIRRFLDQAAFKAGQEGGVIMLGRLRPDTISALLLWGLQERASKVTLAPVSAVLLQE
ncbi:divergent polysaccharide deacetylase family protein [Sulfitobacter aestuarii]|uniref:Divergent polysaccharide deacetylase family protein n=1 Tax=Sulfitobacter aestuarii TaxID=2161676 RepID=A0ABW5U1K3_9RHOB